MGWHSCTTGAVSGKCSFFVLHFFLLSPCAITPSVHFCHDLILLHLPAAFTFSFSGAWEALKALNATLMQNDMGAKTTIVVLCYHRLLHSACIRLSSWCAALDLKFHCALPWLTNPPKQQRRQKKAQIKTDLPWPAWGAAQCNNSRNVSPRSSVEVGSSPPHQLCTYCRNRAENGSLHANTRPYWALSSEVFCQSIFSKWRGIT